MTVTLEPLFDPEPFTAPPSPLDTVIEATRSAQASVTDRLVALRAQRSAVNAEIKTLVAEHERLTSMLRAARGRGAG